jgi:hypothetical protein
MKRKPIPIDPDLRRAAEVLVRNFLGILKEHGDGPVARFDFDETVYKIAKYPQQIRNLQIAAERKKARKRKK